jgi:hydroxymethylpyrimidine/phosphomethylpyrimidine kinase
MASLIATLLSEGYSVTEAVKSANEFMFNKNYGERSTAIGDPDNARIAPPHVP